MKVDLTKFVYDEDDVDYEELLNEVEFKLKQRANEYWRAGILEFDDLD